jgi:tetratricopeptide (TPR) repeat protein
LRASATILGSLLLVLSAAPVAGGGDDDVIRLGPARGNPETAQSPREETSARRAFDYAAFQARLESLWFQRKTLLASGRTEDSREQLEQIRAFCTEEGVKRIENLAGALVAEAYRFQREGNNAHALAALEFAEAFDPGRPQVHAARAVVLWGAGRGFLPAAREYLRALRAAFTQSLRDLSFLPRLVVVVGWALLLMALAFALLMLLRHQAPFRHEIEEWSGASMSAPWPEVLGWTLLALPLLVWVGAGWAAIFWLVITFRLMSRSEQLAAVILLAVVGLTAPAYRIAVGLYGVSADPEVRTTVTSVEGEYDPDRIVKLRQLVETHPEDPVYRFLLAGVYKNGRYFEEAFDEYRAVLGLDPGFGGAHINIGNIFYTTGQYAAAINAYRKALELDGDDFLAQFNLHLAQSEDFHFSEAEESIQRAREIDADRVAELLSRSNDYDDRTAVQDASLDMASVWEAALTGRSPAGGTRRRAGMGSLIHPRQLLNPIAIVCGVALLGCAVVSLILRGEPPARRCIRCGRACCHRCRSGREAQEYCNQCLHLYVLRDGVAPETKAKKLYEVGRHERRTRTVRRLLSLVLPGSAQVLQGRTGSGLMLLGLWFALLVAAVPELFAAASADGLQMTSDLMLPPEVPPLFDPHPGRYLAALALPWPWLAGNWRVWRSAKEI